mmetsp:Transcript_22436/g.72838  ORF Transcript_22436/g.72838 Transcript_22436/m.72838 type:complete len:217 (-) Transcript_22436:28-678(-)
MAESAAARARGLEVRRPRRRAAQRRAAAAAPAQQQQQQQQRRQLLPERRAALLATTAAVFLFGAPGAARAERNDAVLKSLREKERASAAEDGAVLRRLERARGEVERARTLVRTGALEDARSLLRKGALSGLRADLGSAAAFLREERPRFADEEAAQCVARLNELDDALRRAQQRSGKGERGSSATTVEAADKAAELIAALDAAIAPLRNIDNKIR